jgi:hypothetical protein
MHSFEERPNGFEAQFIRAEDLSFRITARRNKLLGLWAAQRLGVPDGDAAEAYAQSIVVADFEVPGDDDVVEKLRADFAAKAVELSLAELRGELIRAALEARRQLTGP